MALDGLSVCALAQEFAKKLCGARLDKIYQPEHDEIHITMHGGGERFRLLLTANANVARACFTEEAKPNPEQPPVFCMLLRKHIGGGKLVEVLQPDFERILEFRIETYNELGDLVTKTLVIEMMGRHSNIILVDENGRIVDAIKRIDFSVSTVRQVLPGMMYESPPGQGKKNPLTIEAQDVLDVLSERGEGEQVDKVLLSRFTGVSPLLAREIVFRALGRAEAYIGELDFGARVDIATQMCLIFDSVAAGEFSPCFLTDAQSKRPLEFSPITIRQYGSLALVEEGESIAAFTDRFYRERDQKEHMAHRSAHLVRLVSNHIERCAKKLILQQKELADTEKKEKWKEYGELITANLYRMSEGLEHIIVQNYYEEDLPEVTIPLDVRLSPSANAQKYYKKYAKAKTAEAELTKQMNLAQEELAYLESVEEALQKAKTEADLSEIAAELAEEGYLRRQGKEQKKKKAESEPMVFETTDGFVVLVGKNNKQNDKLTLKTAHGKDLWFHTKNIPGSHTVLVYENEREFTEQAILEAAQLAAYYSKARQSAQVPVDYTLIKYVKKPAGAKPGFVIYTNHQTAYVQPPQTEDGFKKIK